MSQDQKELNERLAALGLNANQMEQPLEGVSVLFQLATSPGGWELLAHPQLSNQLLNVRLFELEAAPPQQNNVNGLPPREDREVDDDDLPPLVEVDNGSHSPRAS